MTENEWKKELRYIKKEIEEDPINEVDLREAAITIGKLYEAFKMMYRRDMVAVVRCQNCKYWEPENDGSGCGTCSKGNVIDYDYEYCSLGEERIK